jgi:hypothetical protein
MNLSVFGITPLHNISNVSKLQNKKCLESSKWLSQGLLGLKAQIYLLRGAD